MLTSTGYLLIVLLVGGIMYTWLGEWRDMEGLEAKNREIDEFRKEVNNIHVHLIEFSLLGETILEWDDEDLGLYHAQRMSIDSMLCRFKMTYPAERIDSVRHLLEDKERQMRQIVQVFEQQQAINEKINRQVPVIVQKSVQEQPKKTKRKGFLGIFGKKEETKPTVTTTMLRTLNRNMIAEQQAQSRRLSEHADSLAARNAEGTSRLTETGSGNSRHARKVFHSDRWLDWIRCVVIGNLLHNHPPKYHPYQTVQTRNSGFNRTTETVYQTKRGTDSLPQESRTYHYP